MLALAGLLVAPLIAQTQQPPKRSPQHERLDESVGRWIGKGEVKATASNPASKFTYTEDVELLPGGFFLLMRRTSKDSTGTDHGITVMGYDSAKQLYFSETYGGRGDHNSFSGTLDGQTLILNRMNPFTRDRKVVKSRYVSVRLSPTVRSFRTGAPRMFRPKP